MVITTSKVTPEEIVFHATIFIFKIKRVYRLVQGHNDDLVWWNNKTKVELTKEQMFSLTDKELFWGIK